MNKVIYKLNGQHVDRDAFFSSVSPKDDWLERPPMVANTYSEHDPLISEGCGVMKAQVKDAREVVAKHGIPGIAVLDSGQVRFTSRRARKEWLKIRGLHDADGGYSDG